MNINNFSPRPGRLIRENGTVANLADCITEDGKLRIEGVGGGGGGDVEDHNHDDLYYRKDEIDFKEQEIKGELHKIKSKPEDDPDYLSQKIDNDTVVIEDGELRVKRLAGMLFDVHDLNFWLLGTNDPIQMQIDNINSVLAAITSGMKYLGKVETYSDMMQIGNKENGNLVVVLADESRSGGRSMYVYREDLGVWEFIGEFVFSDKFTALQDTPSNYSGSDGKVVRVNEAGEQLYFSDIDYDEVKNKPSSTPTQIDDAVGKRHEHANKESLDRLGVNENGELTINGVVYAPKPIEPVEPTKKQHLYARRSGNQSLAGGSTCIFNVRHSGDIPYSTSTGVFTLEGGRTYRITVAASMLTEGYVILRLAEASGDASPHTQTAIWTDVTRTWREASAGPLDVVITPATTRGYKIYVSSLSGTSSLRSVHSSLVVVEL